jgi:hypothetical protein
VSIYIEGSLNRVCRDIHDHHSRATSADTPRSKFINRIERYGAVKIVSHPSFIRHGSPPAMTSQFERTIIIAVTIRDTRAAKSINPKGERCQDIDRRTEIDCIARRDRVINDSRRRAQSKLPKVMLDPVIEMIVADIKQEFEKILVNFPKGISCRFKWHAF